MVQIATLAGLGELRDHAVLELGRRLSGRLLRPGDDGYDDARLIWNRMIDRRPALIARCAGADDVISAVRFAREHDLLMSVRGGGHNVTGHAVCDRGLMIDLSGMKTTRVDPERRVVAAGPGLTWKELDSATLRYGLGTTGGIISTTGVAGLTLGGGHGWLMRKHGLACDNVTSAAIVTADGRLLEASPEQNPDLFWGVRGGGGNFGIVTAFEFRLHRVGPQVLSGLVVHPFENAEAVLKEYRAAVAAAPDELTCWAVMRLAPPLPFLPAEWHGKPILALVMCHCGDLQAGEAAAARLRGIGRPIADAVAPHPFVGWQQALDPLLTPGARNYWKSHDFIDLSDAAIAELLKAVRAIPDPECEVFIAHVGGAAGRVPTDATAFPQRSAHFVMNVHGRWRRKEMDQACIGWARALFDAAKPFASGTAYVNFMPGDEPERVEAAYGRNYRRLAEAKRRYDPTNLFRMNQNVKPA